MTALHTIVGGVSGSSRAKRTSYLCSIHERDDAQRIAARDHARCSAGCRYLVAPVAEALIDFGTVNRGSGLDGPGVDGLAVFITEK